MSERSGPRIVRPACDEHYWDCARLTENLAAGPDESAQAVLQVSNSARDDWEDGDATVTVFATPMQKGETLSSGTVVCFAFQSTRRRLEVINGSC